MSARVTASDRVMRLLAVIPWIQDHPGATVAEVCERFGMPPAGLLSDLEQLQFVGVPPYHGGDNFDVVIEDDRVWVHLAPAFDRPLKLTAEQALGLVAAGRAMLAVPGADSRGPLARALDKLATAVLGMKTEDVLDVDLGNAAPDVLAAIRTAITESHRLRLDYYSAGRDERSEREVDPHLLWADEGCWYLSAHDHRSGEQRVFRIDRIYDAEVLAVPAERPSGEARPEVFSPQPDAPVVTLELESTASWVVESYPVLGVENLAGGRLRVRLAVAGRAWLERLLLRLGPAGRVTAVDGDGDLAGAGRAAATRILDRYGVRYPPTPSGE